MKFNSSVVAVVDVVAGAAALLLSTSTVAAGETLTHPCDPCDSLLLLLLLLLLSSDRTGPPTADEDAGVVAEVEVEADADAEAPPPCVFCMVVLTTSKGYTGIQLIIPANSQKVTHRGK